MIQKSNKMYYAMIVLIFTVVAGFTINYIETRKIRKNNSRTLDEIQNNIKYDLNSNFESLKKEISSLIYKEIENTEYNSWRLWSYKKAEPDIPSNLRIAHGGGSYNGHNVSNSIDALNANKHKYELFELDLIFTSDKKLVCAHDWEWYPQKVFNKKLDGVPTYTEFMKLVAENNKFKNCTLASLIEWLDETPHARIVTDTKKDSTSAIAFIASQYPNHINRFIPQIYKTSEYDEVSKMGFKDIILTVYSWYEKDNQLVDSTYGKKLFAVTVPSQRAPYLAKKLKNAGHKVYAHTINSQETFDLLRTYGIDEIYTDTLAPQL